MQSPRDNAPKSADGRPDQARPAPKRGRGPARAGSTDLFDRIRAAWDDVASPEREVGIARDVVLVHLGSMSNLFAAMAWTLVHLLERPDLAERVRAGDDALLERCTHEAIRLRQRSIVLRRVLRPLTFSDGKTAFRLEPGVFLATTLAVAKGSKSRWTRKPAEWFIFVFRGSPLFIQFFLAYEAFVLLPKVGIEFNATTRWLTRAWLGATIVLFCNTAAYTGEIFYGALRSVPKGDLEAADAYGLTGWHKFRRITWPTMLRLAWPAYTNEAIFLFHATTLVFFSGFPAWKQMGDALYYANYFADKTFNPFIPYPIGAGFFIVGTLVIILIFGAINRRLNRHLPQARRKRFRFRPQWIR